MTFRLPEVRLHTLLIDSALLFLISQHQEGILVLSCDVKFRVFGVS